MTTLADNVCEGQAGSVMYMGNHDLVTPNR